MRLIGPLLIILLLKSSVLLGAERPIFNIEGNGEVFVGLNNFLTVYKDSSKAMDIGSINGLDNTLFKPFSQVDVSNPESVYWGKISITNRSHVSYQWMLYVGKNDYIDVFLETPEGKLQALKSGYLYPASEKTATLGTYFVPLSIAHNDTVELAIRIEETLHVDPQFDLRLESPELWAKTAGSKIWMDFMFQGVIWIMILYSLSVYVNSGQKESLYYGVYLILVAITYLFLTGLLRQFVLGEFPHLVPYSMTLTPLAAAMYFIFMLEFLDIKNWLSKWESTVKIIIKLNLVIFVALFAFFFLTQYIMVTTRLVQITTLANCMIALVISVQLFYTRDMMARYFVAGTICFLATAIWDSLYWNPSTSEAVVIRLGLIGEILLFSVGLGQKLRLVEKERRNVQYELIKQLKINKQLTEERKEELEVLIKERTFELSERNDELALAIERAEDAARVKSDFLSVMSHEIRTPMNAVIGTIHLLLTEKPQPEQLERLNTLKFAAQNLLMLINNILDFSKIESGNLTLESTPFSLNELVLSITSVYRQKADAKGIDFQIEVDDQIPDALLGDPARITQILNNLISNAIKFTEKGHVKTTIQLISTNNQSVRVEFIIEDTGIGVPQEKQDVIFDSFIQAQSDTNRKYGGTGLGLSITKRLLDLFQSEIILESIPDKGSKFTFSIDLQTNEETRESTEDDTDSKIADIAGKLVLIVDDNEMNLKLVDHIVRKWQLKTLLAISGPKALELMTDHPVDAILLDLQMPEMDGYEVAATIRSMEEKKYKSMPIIALSADTFSKTGHDLQAAGINDFMAKPFSPKALLNKIHGYLNP